LAEFDSSLNTLEGSINNFAIKSHGLAEEYFFLPPNEAEECDEKLDEEMYSEEHDDPQ